MTPAESAQQEESESLETPAVSPSGSAPYRIGSNLVPSSESVPAGAVFHCPECKAPIVFSTELERLRAELKERDVTIDALRRTVDEANTALVAMGQAVALQKKLADGFSSALMAAEAENERLTLWSRSARKLLGWLDRRGGLGLDVHDRLAEVLAAADPD